MEEDEVGGTMVMAGSDLMMMMMMTVMVLVMGI